MNSLLRIKIRVELQKAEEIARAVTGVGAFGKAARSAAAGGVEELKEAMRLSRRELALIQNNMDTFSWRTKGQWSNASSASKLFSKELVEINKNLAELHHRSSAVRGALPVAELDKINKNLSQVGRLQNIKLGQAAARAQEAEVQAMIAAWQRGNTQLQREGQKAAQARVVAEKTAAAEIIKVWQATNARLMNAGWTAQVEADKALQKQKIDTAVAAARSITLAHQQQVGRGKALAKQLEASEVAAAEAVRLAWQRTNNFMMQDGWRVHQARVAAQKVADDQIMKNWQATNARLMNAGWKTQVEAEKALQKQRIETAVIGAREIRRTQETQANRGKALLAQLEAAEAQAAREIAQRWQTTNAHQMSMGWERVQETRKQAETLKKLNASLKAFLKRQANEARADEVRAEREKLETIRRLQRQYAVGQISGGQLRSGLSSLSSRSAIGSSANLAAVEALKKYERGLVAADTQSLRFERTILGTHGRMMQFGKDIQWTGRQLEYNFTLPLLTATRSIFDYQMANERALTRLVKVYDSAGDGTERLSTKYLVMGQTLQANTGKMTAAQEEAYHLGRAFRALSDTYGYQINQVSELGAMWAATGLQGADLARAVQTTMKAMIVGDFASTEDAFKAIVQIQQAYGLTVRETDQALAMLNLTENITAASFKDLTQVIARSGGSARTAGVDLAHLAAIASSLVPATGSAESAGNSLKTLLSRLIAPTNDAIEVMGRMGVAFDEQTFQAMNGAERLEFMAEKFDLLTSAQKGAVSAFVAGRYQLNRFEVLMADIINPTGNYQRVLQALTGDQKDATAVMKLYSDEIAAFLSSTPQGIEIMKTRIKNVGFQILAQLLPAILSVLQYVSHLATEFSRLDPGIQRMVMLSLVAVALVGPLQRVFGAFVMLGAIIATLATKVIPVLVTMLAKLKVLVLANPWVLFVAALVGAGIAVYAFRDKLGGAWAQMVDWTNRAYGAIVRTILRAFYSLPEGVQNALRLTFQVVVNAAMAIYKALQWINPFQRHSPSLVDNVVAGVNLIAAKYASLRNIGESFRQAVSDINAFGSAVQNATNYSTGVQRNELRSDIAVVDPGAAGGLEGMFSAEDQLRAAMAALKIEMDAQENVIVGLEREYDRLGEQLDAANNHLDKLKDTANSLNEQLDAAKGRLADWANTPIAGMRVMEDAIFSNEMAQKALRLEILRMEDTLGPLDEVTNRMAGLAGDIETLQAMQQELRESGAGSEITGPILEQIAALEAQRDVIADQAAPLKELQEELKRLQREGEILDLEKSLQFDPLRRQIDQLTDSLNELPFDEILAGINAERANIADLTRQYEEAEKAVKDQEAVVKVLDTAREDLAATLKIEKAALDELKDAYSVLDDQLSVIEDGYRAISAAAGEMKTAIEEAKRAAEEAAGGGGLDAGDLFDIGGMGNFDSGDLGLNPIPTDLYEDDLKKLADEMLKQAEDQFGKVDLFGPIKEQWDKLKLWWSGTLVPRAETLWDDLKAAFRPLDLDGAFGGLSDLAVKVAGWFKPTLEVIKTLWNNFKNSDAWKSLTESWDELKDAAGRAWDFISEKVQEAIRVIGPELAKFEELVEPGIRAWQRINFVILGVVASIVAFLTFSLAGIMDFITGWLDILVAVWEPAWSLLLPVIVLVLGIIRGLISFFLDIINGDWSKAWEGIKETNRETWENLKRVVKAAVDLVRGWISGFISDVDRDWERFKGSLDGVAGKVLGWASGIGGIIEGIVGWFAQLPRRAIEGVVNIGTSLWNAVQPGLYSFSASVGTIVQSVINFFANLPGNIVSFASRVYNAAWDIGNAVVGGIRQGISNLWNITQGIAGDVGEGLRVVVNNILDGLEFAINTGIANFNRLLIGPLSGLRLPNINLPSFHTGGWVGGKEGQEVLAVLQAGEFVLSRQMVDVLQSGGLLGAANNTGFAPLPSGGDSKVIVFNGDLSFPNITDGHDAEAFIRNLESLAAT
jgi:TP901 family phage tail tape measure protein